MKSSQHIIRRRMVKPVKTPSPAQPIHQQPNTPTNTPARPALLQQATIRRALAAPQRLMPAEVLQLQRVMGNQSVSSLLAGTDRSGVRVGASNDGYEREARQVARQVSGHAPGRDTGAPGGMVSRRVETKIEKARDAGRPVPDQVRLAMEKQTGISYRDVRIHEGQNAHTANEALGARAFTQGKHIFLGKNQSPHNVQLMAHELTHTTQQGATQQGATQPGATKGGPTAARAAGGVPAIQRDDDEKKKKIKKLNKKIGGAKTKRGFAKAGQMGLTALDWLTTLPLRMIDELSIIDLHAKDFKSFVKTGQTREQRVKEGSYTAMEKSRLGKQKMGPAPGSTRRRVGRTGLRALLSGVNIHGTGTNAKLPWYGKLNPFGWLLGGAKAAQGAGKDLGKEIGGMRQQKQGLRQQMVDEMVDDNPENPVDEEVLNEVVSTLVEEEEESSN